MDLSCKFKLSARAWGDLAGRKRRAVSASNEMGILLTVYILSGDFKAKLTYSLVLKNDFSCVNGSRAENVHVFMHI